MLKDVLELIRGSVRPVVTFICIGATVAFIATKIPVPDQWWILVAGIGGFWFGARSATKPT